MSPGDPPGLRRRGDRASPLRELSSRPDLPGQADRRRRTGQLRGLPLGYPEAGSVVPDYNPEDKAIVYGVTGGIPRYLELLDPRRSLRENVIDLFLRPEGYLSRLLGGSRVALRRARSAQVARVYGASLRGHVPSLARGAKPTASDALRHRADWLLVGDGFEDESPG